jgi:DNA-directed RNA polymerase specialized sigma24 family protein
MPATTTRRQPERPIRAVRVSRRTPAFGAAEWAALLAQARLVAARVLRLPTTHPDVEDRAQDALLAYLASGADKFDPSLGTVEAYVATIARNLARSHLRDRATRARLGGLYRAEPAVALSHLLAEAPHRRVEAASDLGRVLDRLCPGHAEALVRIDLAGEPIGEAARHLGKSYVAMNGQVGHARAAARRVALELMAA